MNRIAGAEKFETRDGPEACTQAPARYKFEKAGHKIQVIDTPGTCNINMDDSTWMAFIAEQNSEPIHMVLVAFRASARPYIGQQEDLLTVFEAISNLDARNVGVIFTFCDDKNMNEMVKKERNSAELIAQWKAWLNCLAKSVKLDTFSSMPDSNVFLFNDYGGKTGQKTTQDDLLTWISAAGN